MLGRQLLMVEISYEDSMVEMSWEDNKTMEPELLEELEESQCSTSRLEDDLKQDVCTGG